MFLIFAFLVGVSLTDISDKELTTQEDNAKQEFIIDGKVIVQFPSGYHPYNDPDGYDKDEPPATKTSFARPIDTNQLRNALN